MNKIHPTGLRNLGNTCFMNSALQCLTHSKGFSKLMIDLTKGKRRKKDVTELMIEYFRSYKSKAKVFAPRFLFSNLRKINPVLTPGRQHDSHEFIISVLDKISVGLKKRGKIKEFENVFGGVLCSQVKCSNCKRVSKTNEKFSTLSLVNFPF